MIIIYKKQVDLREKGENQEGEKSFKKTESISQLSVFKNKILNVFWFFFYGWGAKLYDLNFNENQI